MPEDSRFFENRDHSESEFAEVVADWSEDGVYQHADQRLALSAPGGLQINVAAGRAIVQGFWYRLTVATGLAIAFNGSGQLRYDRIVLRLQRGPNSVVLAVRQGVGGAGIPALSRAYGGDWEISLGWVSVGPGVTDLTAANIGDERSYTSVCGWANRSSFIGAPALNGIPAFAGFSDDPDTGLQNVSADRIDVLAGAKGLAYFASNVIGIGAYNIPTTLRAGGAAGYGNERIYVDQTYVLIGRDGSGANTGPTSIQIGTSTTTTGITFGNAINTGFTFQGNAFTFTAPSNANGNISVNITEGYAGVVTFTNPNVGNNKQFVLVYATAPGQGLGGAGDASIYTAGSAAGRLILGSQGGSRMIISNTAITFGYQTAKANGFNFQQGPSNGPAYGLRLFHNNQVHHNDWYSNDEGRHTWAINDVPQMWLFTSGQFTIGGPNPRPEAGWNFQQTANVSNNGMHIWHTNQVHQIQYYADDTGRHVWGINNVPQMWLFTSGQYTIGGTSPKGNGFNFVQAANNMYNGVRIFHTNEQWHGDIFTDGGARLTFGINDNPKFAIASTGEVTIGPTATDAAALHIPQSFGDVEKSGILLTAAGAQGHIWLHSSGPLYLASATHRVMIHHSPLAFTPEVNNQTNLGLPAQFWSNLYCGQGFKTGGGNWQAISDERAKDADSVRPFRDGMYRVMELDPIAFHYNGTYGIEDTEREYVGFSAQNLLDVAPEMVGTIRVKKNAEADEEDVYTVDTSPLIFILLNAMKEHEGRLRVLEGKS